MCRLAVLAGAPFRAIYTVVFAQILSLRLAAPSDLEAGGWIHAVFGEDGIEAHAKYVVRGGKFVKGVDASATG